VFLQCFIIPVFLHYSKSVVVNQYDMRLCQVCGEVLDRKMIFCGAAAQIGPRFEVSKSYTHTHTHTHTHTWYDSFERVISSSQRPLPTKLPTNSESYIHSTSGIRTCDPSSEAAADQVLRPHGHRSQRRIIIVV
jgi:hypothetical protein